MFDTEYIPLAYQPFEIIIPQNGGNDADPYYTSYTKILQQIEDDDLEKKKYILIFYFKAIITANTIQAPLKLFGWCKFLEHKNFSISLFRTVTLIIWELRFEYWGSGNAVSENCGIDYEKNYFFISLVNIQSLLKEFIIHNKKSLVTIWCTNKQKTLQFKEIRPMVLIYSILLEKILSKKVKPYSYFQYCEEIKKEEQEKREREWERRTREQRVR